MRTTTKRIAFMKFVGMVLLLPVVAGIAFGQQHAVGSSPDTAKATGIVILDAGLSTGHPTLILPRALQYEETPEDTSIFAFWKKTAVRPPLLGGLIEPKADLTATLRAQWAKESQFGTLRSVLGAVQLGGVAYMAVRALTSTDTPKPIRKKR